MTHGRNLAEVEAPAQALPGWLETFVDLIPSTVTLHVEVSGIMVLILLLLILRPPPRGPL